MDDAKQPPSNSKRVKEISKASLELAIEKLRRTPRIHR
jgi:hypothetical protein